MSAAKLEAIKDVGRKGQVGTAGEVGHGLGLVVARGLAEQMELALEITSERGKGTVATITLPAKKA
jgi:signal transduction histidine kinase